MCLCIAVQSVNPLLVCEWNWGRFYWLATMMRTEEICSSEMFLGWLQTLIQFGASLKYKDGFVFGIILQFEVVQFRDNGRVWGHFHTFHGPFKAGAKEWEDYNSCASLYNQVVAPATCLCTDWHWPFERAAFQSLNNRKMQVMVSLTKYLVALQEEGFRWRTF